ncbi:MAG: pseudouridine synthase [Spirochaetota bacterium]
MKHYPGYDAVKDRKVESLAETDTPVRLDAYLASRFTYRTRTQWKKAVRSGDIEVNGTAVTQPSRMIKNGDRIVLCVLGRSEPEVDAGYTVLLEDELLLCVSKSGDIPVHPAGPYFNNTLTTLLEDDFGCRLYTVHRLDRETSGVILFAKNPGTASRLSAGWNRTRKEYLAIVHGSFTGEIRCTVPIGPAYEPDDNRTGIVRKKRKARDGAPESADTLFSSVVAGESFSLIRAVLGTGRRHQIRVHCRYLDFPIVGDKIYGTDERLYLEFIENGMTNSLLERCLMPRCALHSHRLTFIHPGSEAECRVTALLPDDMSTFMKKSGIAAIEYTSKSRSETSSF